MHRADTSDGRTLCASCGRPITPRRSHRGRGVRYCSRRCPARRVGPRERALEAAVLAAVDARPDGSVRPSEVARAGRAVDAATARGPIRLRKPRR